MPCPDLDELAQYAENGADEHLRSSIDRHVRTCAACRRSLDELAENLRSIQPIRAALLIENGETESRRTPKSIGRYRIRREIGRGGMGCVYEAEQDHPRRIVALKVIGPGLAGRDAIRRFEHEAEILARLRHPGIAQIYDAGTADTGAGRQPFFAMELIEGQTLREYAHRNSPGVRTILDLMARICDAVQHAHQNGVIHRDLKPANILIDRSGQPRILDFGVARMTDSDLQATTMSSDAAQLIGTLPYMSPEQAGANVHALDTRSDIYALGVITYELLTNRLPYSLENRIIPDALRVIQEQEATPLSAVNKTLRGDVETIVSKALEKDRTRRYQSAAELAADIRRYLDDQPIMARPPSALYQLTKFAQRNRGLVGGALVAVTVLAIGAAVSTWQAVRATRAENLATVRLDESRREAAKSRAVSEFLQDMLSSGDPAYADGGGSPDVRLADVLASAVERLDDGSLAEQPEIEAAIRTTIGNVYRSLGKYEQAEPLLRQAVALGRSVYPQGHADLALALNKLARLLQEMGRYDEAEPLFREALAMRRTVFGDEHVEVANVMSNLGWLLTEMGRFDEAEKLHRESLAMRRRTVGEQSGETATGLNNLGVLLYNTGRQAEAVPLLRESLAIDRALRGDHPNVASTMANLATALISLQEFDEAETLLREALAMKQRLFGREHPEVATQLNNLATLLYRRGDLEAAEPVFREAVALERRVRGDRHPWLAKTLSNFANALVDQGRFDEAERLRIESLAIRREVLGDDHPDTLVSLHLLGQLYMTQEQYDRAEPWLLQAYEGAKRSLPEDHWFRGAFQAAYGACLAKMGRYEDAEPALLAGHALLEKTLGPQHHRTRAAIRVLADLYDAWNKPATAAEWRAKLSKDD